MSSHEGYLSDRVIATKNTYNPMREAFNATADLIFNPDANILNIGIAQNDLMTDILKEKVSFSFPFSFFLHTFFFCLPFIYIQ